MSNIGSGPVSLLNEWRSAKLVEWVSIALRLEAGFKALLTTRSMI